MLLSRAARSLRRLEHVKGLQKKGRVTSCVQIQISRPRRLMGTPKGDYEKVFLSLFYSNRFIILQSYIAKLAKKLN